MRHSWNHFNDFDDFDDDDNDNHILFYYYSCATSFINSAYDSLLHTYTVVLTLSREVCISLFYPQSYLTMHYNLFLSHKITQTCSQPPMWRLEWVNRFMILFILSHIYTYLFSSCGIQTCILLAFTVIHGM
jgi:hypothetical protein